jgi:heme-degrading monooxygenase HmoA
MTGVTGGAGLAIVFEYRVSERQRPAFERTYGSDGDWARFFREDPAYRGSELWALTGAPGRYIVVDRWDSAEAYHAFRDRHRAEYERRSAETASLYETERVIGELERRG